MIEFPEAADPLPWLTTAQMIEVDRAMIEDRRIDLVQMMENAGRNLAHLARHRFLAADPRGRRIVVLVGTGGNGGTMVSARRLHNWGALVEVFVTRGRDRLASVPRHQLEILQRMKVPVHPGSEVEGASEPDLVIDGLIGYSLRGAPRGAAARLIEWANKQTAPVLSLDVPSGVELSTCTLRQPTIRATATLTLALPKEGLRAAGVKGHVGELYLADISVPPKLYGGLGLDVGPVFALSETLRL